MLINDIWKLARLNAIRFHPEKEKNRNFVDSKYHHEYEYEMKSICVEIQFQVSSMKKVILYFFDQKEWREFRLFSFSSLLLCWFQQLWNQLCNRSFQLLRHSHTATATSLSVACSFGFFYILTLICFEPTFTPRTNSHSLLFEFLNLESLNTHSLNAINVSIRMKEGKIIFFLLVTSVFGLAKILHVTAMCKFQPEDEIPSLWLKHS